MRLIKAKEVASLTSISIPHIRRLAREGKFPKPIPISKCRSGWLEEEVLDWISQCVRKHRSN